MVYKLILAIVASTTVAAPAFAAADEGPYIGVGVTNANFNGSHDAEGIGFSGPGASAFAGYNIPLGKLFASVEANFDLSNADVGDTDRGIEVRYAYGATARLGYHLSDAAVLYGRLGYQRTHVYDYVDSEQNSENRHGLRVGAGVEANVSKNVAVRVEYTHTQNERTTIEDIKAGVDSNQGTLGVVFGF